MSDLDLDAIRARADAATPGPWKSDSIRDVDGFNHYRLLAVVPKGEDWPLVGMWDNQLSRPDAEFIAHAREDIPALLDEVDRLRRACRTIGHVMDHIYESLRPIIDAAGLGGLIDEDGDGDWELVWEKLQQRVVEVDRLQAAIDRVREVHQPIDAAAVSYHPYRSCQVCIGCGQDDGNWQQWPCPTIRAIEAGESDE